MTVSAFLGNGFDDEPRICAAGSGAFADYDLDARFYEESFRNDGTPMESCRKLVSSLSRASANELATL